METRKVGKVGPFFEVKKISLPRGSGVGDPRPTGWYWPAKCISEGIFHLNLFLNAGELFEMLTFGCPEYYKFGLYFKKNGLPYAYARNKMIVVTMPTKQASGKCKHRLYQRPFCCIYTRIE